VNSLLPEDVRQFIVDQLQTLGTTSNAITIASTLRAYLRYRATCGDAVQPLLAPPSDLGAILVKSGPESAAPQRCWMRTLVTAFVRLPPAECRRGQPNPDQADLAGVHRRSKSGVRRVGLP
jgi:hypothetical protein